MKIRDRLIARIERYRERNNLSETQFSARASGNPNFLHNLRRGKVTLESIERAEEYLDLHEAVANGQLQTGDTARV